MATRLKTFYLTVPFILSIVAGVGLSQLVQSTPKKEVISKNSVTSHKNNLYTTQSAIIRGRVLAATETTLLVQNSSTIRGMVGLSESVKIEQVPKDPSDYQVKISDLNRLQPNQEAVIHLELIEGSFKAVLIQLTKPINFT